MTALAQPVGASALAEELVGPLLLPGGAGYDEEVAAFNAAVTHRPALVVGAATAADVRAAVRYAAAHGLPIAVQSTGHGATAPIEGGVLINTRRLNGLSVDPVARTVTVGAGVRWREVIVAVAPYGLAPLSGSSSDVSAVGYTLGGGLPVMARTFGFAADRVRSFEVVTADGALRHVEPGGEPELFWALCGGKGNLGIVTAMTIELVEVATMFGGGIFYDASHIPAVLHAYAGWAADLPEQISSSVAILRLPPAPQIPEPIRGRTVAHLRVCHVGDVAEGERLVAPMRKAAPALLDHLGTMPYTAVDSIYQDPDHPVPFCHRGTLLRELTGDTVDALLGVAGPDVRAPLIVCELRQMGGALRRGPAAGNAVGGRDAAYCLSAIGLLAPETAAAAQSAIDAVMAAAQPWSTGHTLVNLHGAVGDEADRARAWEPATYRRLAELVRRLDPAGLLRYGHTIGREPAPIPAQS
jgi:FAD/FMN-containing dehydrogenase